MKKFSILVLISLLFLFSQAQEKKYFNLSPSKQKSIFNLCKPQPYISTPENWQLGSMGGFYTLDEAYAEIDTMVLLYPELVSFEQIGSQTSFEGRPIFKVKISDNVADDENEPEALYTAIHHSQEPASLQQLIFFMYFLLENYDSNPEIQYIVNNTELFFVPVINPDGYFFNQTENPDGGGLHRKNRRTTFFSDGVDLNRNYDYAFGYNEIGSSSIGFHPWHRGDSAFSEPETQAMKFLIENRNFVIALNWHSYGNYLIYPYNFDSGFVPANIDVYKNFARFLTMDNNFRYGTCDETYGYSSNGDADDWANGIHNIVSLTAEIGTYEDGFWPEISRIEQVCRENVAMNKKIALLSNAYSVVNDLSIGIYDQINGYFTFELQCLGLDTPSVFSVWLEPLGTEMISTGSANNYSNVHTLDVLNDSISYSLNPSIENGQEFSFIVCINNGLFTFRDTLTKTFGIKTFLLQDNCNNMDLWTGDDWSVTNEDFVSGPNSFTESPGENYGLLQTSELELINEIDLTNANKTSFSFNVRFNTEKSYDWLQVYASTDYGVSWLPLCGKLSSYGTDDQNLGEPVWDGEQAYWIKEEISLDNFIGENIKLKFRFESDQTNTYDGVYLDDIELVIIDNDNVFSIFPEKESTFQLVPNPADNIVEILSSLPEISQKQIIVSDLLGKVIRKQESLTFDVSSFAPGTYFVVILENGVERWRTKFMVL